MKSKFLCVFDNLRFLFLFVILFFFLFSTFFYYSKSVSSDISSKVFRLHIVANSDSVSDQLLKIKVRDAVLKYMNSIIDKSMSRDEIIHLANTNILKFQEIASSIINENGESYDVLVEIGNFYFPTKSYGDVFFPAGYYDSLNIKIGKATGHNWWCVMFPPLCFVDANTGVLSPESNSYLEENITDEDYDVISKKNSSYSFKFKIVEMMNSFFDKNRESY